MKFFNKKIFKIILLLAAAFVVSDFSIKNIFLANSPKINPYAGQNILAKINNVWSNTTSLVASIGFKSSAATNGLIKDLPKNTLDALSAPMSKVSQGVYAGERNGIKVYDIKSNEIEYSVYSFTVNGKPVTVKIPKGDNPPTQAELDKLYP